MSYNHNSIHDTGPFEDSAFYKWFWEAYEAGHFDKDYVSRWDLFGKSRRDRVKNEQKENN